MIILSVKTKQIQFGWRISIQNLCYLVLNIKCEINNMLGELAHIN